MPETNLRTNWEAKKKTKIEQIVNEKATKANKKRTESVTTVFLKRKSTKKKYNITETLFETLFFTLRKR